MSEPPFAVIDAFPLPLTVAEAERFQQQNPMFTEREDDETLHPDELCERYLEILAQTREWRVFRVHIYGFSGTVFLWNHQFGWGLRIDDCEGTFDRFATAVATATQDRRG